MSYLKQLNETEPYEILGYGHLGDGNVHVNVLNRSEPLEKWTQDIPVLKDKLMEQTLKLGGTITGEHGVGLTKKRYLQAMFSSETIGIMKAVKRVFDPNNILNPTKIF